MDRGKSTSAIQNGPPPRRWLDLLLWVGLLLAAAAVLAAAIAHGPGFIRRPLLTPLIAGAAVGWLAQRLEVFVAIRTDPWHPFVPALGSVLLLGLVHQVTFSELEAAAARWGAEHPRERALLMEVARWEEGEPSAAASRQRRMRVQPTWRDYLAERSTVLLGESPWPAPLVLLVVEVVGSSVMAAGVYRRGANAGRSEAATPAAG
jgi:hypothetical protein